MFAADHQHIVNHGPYSIHIKCVTGGPVAEANKAAPTGSKLVALASLRIIMGHLASLSIDGIHVWRHDDGPDHRLFVTFPTWSDPDRRVPTEIVSFDPSYGCGVLGSRLREQIACAYDAAVQAEINRTAEALGE